MPDQDNALSPAEAERLHMLIEELGEAQQAAAKVLRHGYNAFDPARPTCTNRDDLVAELGDVTASIWFLQRAGDVGHDEVRLKALEKSARVAKYTYHQPERLKEYG